MTLYTPISPVDIKQVGLSWLDDNLANYEVGMIPQVDVLGFENQRDTTNYRLPALSNGLFGPGTLVDWKPGQAHPTGRELDYIAAQVAVKYKAQQPINRVRTGSSASNARILTDLEQNIVPLLYAGLYQRMSVDVVSLMVNASVYGTAKTFSGTGALDTYAADQAPDVDINTNLQPMVKWKGLGFKLECFMSYHVAQVLAAHPRYTGAGTGSAIASTLPLDVFKQRFMAAHPLLDALHICMSTTETTRPGQTSDALLIGNTLLWFGLVDRRKQRFDLRSQEAIDAPDGAIAIAHGFDPYVENWVTPGSGVESFQGRCEYGVFFPRANDAAKADFAHFYSASEIFTATPS